MVIKSNITDYDFYPCKYVHLNNVKPISIITNNTESNYFVYSATDGVLIQNVMMSGKKIEDRFCPMRLKISALCQLDENNLLFATASKTPEIIKWNYNSEKIVRRMNLPFVALQLYATQHFNKFVCIYQKQSLDDIYRKKERHAVVIDLDDNNEPIISTISEFKNVPTKCVSFCKSTGHFAFATSKNSIVMTNIYNFTVMDHCKQKLTISSPNNMITCVEFSVDGFYLAVGTNNGLIYVYETESLHLTSRLHWHCRSIEGLLFDRSANNYLYSIGHEGTLVQWNVSIKTPHFIPRISKYPLKYIVGSTNRLSLVDSHDEIIHIDSRSIIICNRSVSYRNQTNNLIGLKFCPVNQCLVSNGRWGMIDFYSPSVGETILSLSVVKKNIVTINQTTEIDVTDVAFTHRGQIMITIEQPINKNNIYLKNISDFIKIKWWLFDSLKQSFRISQTRIHPHFSSITSITNNNLQYQPLENHYSDDICPTILVTTSKDSIIKIWSCSKSPDSWKCVYTLSYKKLIPNNCALSENSELLAVSMTNCVVIWSICKDFVFSIKTVIPFHIANLMTFGNRESSNILFLASNTLKYSSFYNIETGHVISTFANKNIHSVSSIPKSGNICLITDDSYKKNKINLEIYRPCSANNNIGIENIIFTANSIKKQNEHKQGIKLFVLQNIETRMLQPLYVVKNILRVLKKKIGINCMECIHPRGLCFMNDKQTGLMPLILGNHIPSLQLISQPLFIQSSNNDIFCFTNKTHIYNLKKNIKNCKYNKEMVSDGIINNMETFNYNSLKAVHENVGDDERRTKQRKILSEINAGRATFDDEMLTIASHTLSDPTHLLKKLLSVSVVSLLENNTETCEINGDNAKKYAIDEVIKSTAACIEIPMEVKKNEDSYYRLETRKQKSSTRRSLNFVANLEF